MKLTIYHNPRCSTSRKTLDLLREKGADVEVREYLKSPLEAQAILALASIIEGGMDSVIRKKEPLYQELLVNVTDEAEIARVIAENPVLINRPIVSNGVRALATRPPELALQLLE